MNENAAPCTRLSSAEELTVAMTTAAAFAKAHQHADFKISALFLIHGGLITATATQFVRIREVYQQPGVASWIVLGLLGLLALGFVVGGYYLVQSFRPRTKPPKESNRFAFADFARRASSCPASSSAREQCEEAWKLAKLLGAIATTKFRYTSLAIGWIAFMLVDFLALMAYVTVGNLLLVQA
jgi:hypothetical protein